MHYDPIKNIFASFIRNNRSLRAPFYKLLDLMFLRSWYVRRELTRLRKKFGATAISIYDAGTGFGQYTWYMAKNLKPNKIFSVDVKEDWIEDCKEFFALSSATNVAFSIEDLTKITHQNAFDLVICIDVMEHIEDDRTVFKNFANALKPGGYLLVNSPSIFGGSDVHEDEDESFIGEHARDGYSREDLAEKTGAAGLEEYRSEYTYGFWGDKAWRLGIKYPMMMLNASKLLLVLLPFYYLLTFPFTLIMMYMDMAADNKTGSGITFIARKPE